MAITVNKTPVNRFNPITIPTEFSVSSTNVNQSNFKYVCDVYVDGEPIYYRMKQSPHPTNGYCVFDVSGILKSFVSSDAPKTATIVEFAHASNSYKNYTLKFGEEYGASSAVVVYPNLTSLTTNFYGVINATLDFDEWAGDFRTMDDYTILNSTKKFLTNAPSNQKVYPDTRAYLYFLNNTAAANAASYVKYMGYDNTNNNIVAVKFDTTFDDRKRIQYVGVGYENVELIDGTEPGYNSPTGSLPFITGNTGLVYYTVQLFDVTDQPLTEIRTFTPSTECNVGDTYQLIFQNKLGGYDTFSFTAPSDKSYQITTRDMFKKKFGQWISNKYEYKPYQRGTTQYNTIYKDQIVIKSDWLTEEESEWLHELVTSPDVYMVIDGREELLAINIIDAQYQVKQYAKDQLFNLQLTIEKSFNRYRQQF